MIDYLKKYAEPEAQSAYQDLDQLTQPKWNAVAVLPLLAEPDAIQTIRSLQTAASFGKKKLLTIAVVNAKESASQNDHSENQKLLQSLSKEKNVLIVDRATTGKFFPPDQGVGLARKIGCDLAIALIARGHLSCDFIHTTDGDAIVAPDYFSPPISQSSLGLDPSHVVTLWHQYRHELESQESLSLCLYEISLRYYVLGLRFAESPFAFPTVGSTQAFTPKAYCEVRGFPRREAGEDFYLVNKLAKVGGVAFSKGLVRLKARPSARVPFGTGAAMRKIEMALANGAPFPLYHPQIFLWLKDWLIEMNAFCEHRDIDIVRNRLREKHQEPIITLLNSLKAWEALTIAMTTRPQPDSCRRHLHTWFDAFRTLKFIHAARDNFLGWVHYPVALNEAPFLLHEYHLLGSDSSLTKQEPYQLLNALRHLEDDYYVAPRLAP